MHRKKLGTLLLAVVLTCTMLSQTQPHVFASQIETMETVSENNVNIGDNNIEESTNDVSKDNGQGDVDASKKDSTDTSNIQNNENQLDSAKTTQNQTEEKNEKTDEKNPDIDNSELYEAVLEGDNGAKEEEAPIEIALPTEFKLTVDAFGLEHDDSDRQIFSDCYEVVNHGEKDVIVTVTPILEFPDCELVATPPEKGMPLHAIDREIKRAAYIALCIDRPEILEDVDAAEGKYESVLSVDEPESISWKLTGTNEKGEVSPKGSFSFGFTGNVDTGGLYRDGEIDIKLVFSFETVEE